MLSENLLEISIMCTSRFLWIYRGWRASRIREVINYKYLHYLNIWKSAKTKDDGGKLYNIRKEEHQVRMERATMIIGKSILRWWYWRQKDAGSKPWWQVALLIQQSLKCIHSLSAIEYVDEHGNQLRSLLSVLHYNSNSKTLLFKKERKRVEKWQKRSERKLVIVIKLIYLN